MIPYPGPIQTITYAQFFLKTFQIPWYKIRKENIISDAQFDKRLKFSANSFTGDSQSSNKSEKNVPKKSSHLRKEIIIHL